MLPKEIYFIIKDRHHLKPEGWKKDISNNFDCDQIGVALLVTDQIVLKSKLSRRDKDYFIILKRRIHQEGTIILSKHAQNIRTHKL